MIKNIIVTGGAGFIGSHLVKRLVKQGHNVTVLDNLDRGKEDYIKDVLDKIKFINCDLTKYKKIKKYFKKVDIVYHLASKVGGIGTYINEPYSVMDINIKMDLNVLKCVIKNKIQNYFYASSAHIYPKELQNSYNSPIIKESDAYPSNPELTYGWAKLIGEKLIESALKQNEWMRVSIARFIGIYGANQDFNLDTGSVIPVFSHRAIKYPYIPFNVWGNGKETRTYCYIEDALDCVEKMVNMMEINSLVGPYNVGSSHKVSIEEIAKTIIEISGKEIKIDWDETKKTVIWGQTCDISKAEKELGWKSKTTLKEGLQIVYNDIKFRL